MSEPTPETIEAALAPAVNTFRREMKENGILTSLHPTVLSMRAALSAAAPYLIREAQAQALEDAAHWLDLPGSSATGYYSSNDDAGYREAETHVESWLRARAAAIRDGAPVTGPWLCPECRAGKHRNCVDEAWNDDTDEPTDCECEGCPDDC